MNPFGLEKMDIVNNLENTKCNINKIEYVFLIEQIYDMWYNASEVIYLLGMAFAFPIIKKEVYG